MAELYGVESKRTWNDEDDMYPLEELEKAVECRVVVPGELWALVEPTDKHWVKVTFVEWYSSNADGTNMMVCPLFTSEGATGYLRECRHTNFRDDGYLFYMNFTHMRAALDFLEQYFDGD